LDNNAKCEQELLKVLNKPADADIPSAFHDASLETFEKPNAKLLEAFVRANKFEDAGASWIVPNKGKASTANDLCKETKGPLLIKMVYDSQLQVPIAKILNLPPAELPRVLLPEPSVVEFSTMMQLESFNASEEYCRVPCTDVVFNHMHD